MSATMRVFCAVTFIFVLLCPSTIQLAHAFNHAEHSPTCKEIKTHLHTKEVDCHLFDFQLEKSTYLTHHFHSQNSFEEHYKLPNTTYISVIKSAVRTNSLRAPPFSTSSLFW